MAMPVTIGPISAPDTLQDDMNVKRKPMESYANLINGRNSENEDMVFIDNRQLKLSQKQRQQSAITRPTTAGKMGEDPRRPSPFT